MNSRGSFPAIVEKIITYNRNLIEILSKLNTLYSTSEPTVNVSIIDDDGVLKEYSLPSFNYLKSEIDRINNNINSIYNIDNINGTYIKTTSGDGKYKKVISVNINKEPNDINEIGIINKFKSEKNWIFDGLLNPLLYIEIDLNDKISDDVKRILVRRYIVEFSKNEKGQLTNSGKSALMSFTEKFKNKSNINIDEFLEWHKNTQGVVEPFNPNYDEQIFDMSPNKLKYDGKFTVLGIEEDKLNKKLWYKLNTIDYLDVTTNELKQLSINDEVIINSDITNTRYKVIEISNAGSNYMVRFERVEGLDPIPVGINTLKIYSPVIYSKKFKISIGYDEYNVIFIKLINDNNIMSKNWSHGTAFYTNDLILNSDDDTNGMTMDEYYTQYVHDYGEVLRDLVAKKTPNKLAGMPAPPVLNPENFKVVQINKHLTDNPDVNKLKTKSNYLKSIKSEITQIDEAIESKNKKAKISNFSSKTDKKQFDIEIDSLIKKRDMKVKLLSSITKEILELSKSPAIVNNEPKFRVRGFWAIPEPVMTRGTKPQEIIQFRIRYRYLSKDGKEPPVETYKIETDDGGVINAAYSNWIEFKSDVRKRVYDPSTGEYVWQIEDVESADTPNINQIDIPIKPNEKVEIMVKSISEVGWPESPVESEWSEPIIIDFPDDLNNIVGENDFILKEATAEEMRVSIRKELSARGLDEHLSDTIVINDTTFHHDSKKIFSGFKDENGLSLSLYDYLKSLHDRILYLEEKVKRARGEIEVFVIKNDKEYIIKNGSEITFNIECEDYLDIFSGSSTTTNVSKGRVYANNIYVIKDFSVKIKNKSIDSPLGLLSNRKYNNMNSEIYNSNAPQVFWVNDKDELLFSSSTGQTRTQLDHQFIWCVNYENVTDNVVTKLSENIENNFISEDNNSLTHVLGSSEYNIGYNETTLLSFVGNNNSLMDINKWIDKSVSVASTTKLLTTIHPVIPNLEDLTENNSEKIKIIRGGDENAIIIPINIYFKMNALDPTQSGLNYEYIDLNSSTKTIKHVKKIKFFMEPEYDNKPFTFVLKFIINRNKVIVKKIQSSKISSQINLSE